MARFNFNGVDSLDIDLQRMVQLDDDTRWSILEAGANVFKRVFQEYLNKFHHRTGHLADSITITRFESFKSVRVWPYGKVKKKPWVRKSKKMRDVLESHEGSGASKRKKHHGKTGGSSTMDVAYYLEYGTPRMPATHWMENAIELAQDEATEAMQEAWDEHVKKCGF